MFDLAGASGQCRIVFDEVLLLKQFSSEETMGEEAAGCWQLGQQPIHHHISAIWSHGSVTSNNKTSESRFRSRHQEPRSVVTKCHGVYQTSTNPNQNEIIVIVKYF